MILAAVCVMMSMNSCATIFSGSRKNVAITSSPSGARVYVNGQDKNVTTPAQVKVKKKAEVNYEFKKEGYEDAKYVDHSKFDAMFLGNILLGGIPGMAVDLATGAYHRISPNIHANMTPLAPVPPTDPTIRAGEAANMVNRDAPGQTALERTIIRWHFDSEPRGARIFWRVISSIPDEVKNTNETYLTTTPYEETRSFNILGLTYENSRDVVIEVKLTMPGYHDQVKRYNVRQAIDQQEISGFWDMVKRPTE